MNEFDLQAELNRNDSDKQITKAELEVSRNKWAEYVVRNKDKICSFNGPTIVRKKRIPQIKEFITKIKIIFGLIPKEKKNNGIEAYLQYCDSID